MAKISYSKLGLKRLNNVCYTNIGETEIEVIQYLPVNDKLELITDVLSYCIDNNNFLNTVKFDMFLNLFILRNYTNITITDKQWEDIPKLYDMLQENKIFDIIMNAIPAEELSFIRENALKIVEGYFNYRNSIYGILDNMNIDSEHLAEQVNELQKQISDKDNLQLLNNVLTKMG